MMRDKKVESSICFLISVFSEFLKCDFTLLADSCASQKRRILRKTVDGVIQVRFLVPRGEQVALQREEIVQEIRRKGIKTFRDIPLERK